MEFRLEISQTDEDRQSKNNFERTCTLTVNSSYPKIKLQLPESYGGLCDKDKNNLTFCPEDLYLGALSGCFFTTFNVVSKNSNLEYEKIEITSKGIMDVMDDVKQMIEISQDITLTLPKSMEKHEGKAKKVLEITDKRCPLANSVKTIIKNTYTIIFSNS